MRLDKKVPQVLYLTGKGPMPRGLNASQVEEIENAKQRWEEFLDQRPPKMKDNNGPAFFVRCDVCFIATSQLPGSDKVSFDDRCAAPSVFGIKL